jgi:3-oxoacyl-[acyl-carrier-protein] synthase III
MQRFHHNIPTHSVTNNPLEEKLGLPEGWIFQRTGIKQRFYHDNGVSDLAIQCAQQCLTSRHMDPRTIDTVLMATVTPDNPWPATACKVANAIGANNAWALDISAACSGFVYALQLIKALLTSGQAKNILLITGDCMSSVIDPLDRNTSILFGDACVASIWSSGDELEIIDIHLGCDGSGYNDIMVRQAGSANRQLSAEKLPSLYLEGGRVFRAAVTKMSESIITILERNQKSIRDIQWFIPHQANMRIIEALALALDIPNEKVLTNIENRGNTTNASIPLCWSENQHQIKNNDLVLVTSFGAGYTYGSALLHSK